MTAALATITALDDGLPVTSAARLAADRYDAHLSDRQHRRELLLDAYAADVCLICGTAGEGLECDRCTAGHDFAVARSADV